VQRAYQPGSPKSGVKPVGFCERIRIGGNHGIDVGALPVIGVDPIEVALHQLARSEPAGAEGCVDIVDRGLYDLKRRGAGGLGVRRSCE
jgi:hypothetical protein